MGRGDNPAGSRRRALRHAAGYADLETRSGAVMQERPIRTAFAYDQANARPRSRLTFGCILMRSADVALHPPQRG
jgi:hypothetical protein